MAGCDSAKIGRRFDLAIEVFEWLRSKGVESDGLYNSVGLCYLERKENFDLAADAFQTACDKKPDLAIYYDNLGYAQCALAEYRSAIVSFNRADELRGNENYPEVYKLPRQICELERLVEIEERENVEQILSLISSLSDWDISSTDFVDYLERFDDLHLYFS